MRIGMIVRAENTGLSTLSWEFVRHLCPAKIVIVESGVYKVFPERFIGTPMWHVPPEGSITEEISNWLLTDIDVLLSIETFYSWDIVGKAREREVKTALITMFEMCHESLVDQDRADAMTLPDLFICPSKLDYQIMPSKKVFLPVPVATDRLQWKQRKVANHFIHTASHGGMNFRKGTPLLIEAMKYVKSDIRLTIYSWMKFKCSDPRVEIKFVEFKNYWQLWETGDVLVYPQDYNGICLPVVEAMASGLGVMTTNMFPFNEYMPNELLFSPYMFYKSRVASGLVEVKAANIHPKNIAEKIDEFAGKDISKFSLYGKKWGEENSWEVLLPKWQAVLEQLCRK